MGMAVVMVVAMIALAIAVVIIWGACASLIRFSRFLCRLLAAT
jgi:hypothetical protein